MNVVVFSEFKSEAQGIRILTDREDLRLNAMALGEIEHVDFSIMTLR